MSSTYGRHAHCFSRAQTFVSDILVAVNPFKKLPIYGKDVSRRTRHSHTQAMEQYKNKQREDLPPHVYAISDACYHNLFKMKKNQCVVIRCGTFHCRTQLSFAHPCGRAADAQR